MKKIVAIIVTLFISFEMPLSAFAEELPEEEAALSSPLLFRAVNAGYKDEQSAQNYDFFELARTTENSLDLSEYKVQYYNASDNLAGELEFAEYSALQSETAVFGFNKSPQYLNAPVQYLYSFSVSGLASTAGRLRLI